MKQNIKGFANLLILVGVGIAIVFGSTLLLQSESQKTVERNLGSAIIQTNISDTIGTFRTNVNTSLVNLSSDLASVTGTIAAYGNIVTENTPLAVNKGGTATTTTPTGSFRYFGANSSVPTWKTIASSTGITLTETATSVTIGTAGFDSSADISFTGQNTFSATTTFNGNLIGTAFPAGVIQMYASSTAPQGWLLANGTSYATSSYPRLFAVIGYQYGGSGANFSLPNFKFRFPLGFDSTNASSSALGMVAGSATTTYGGLSIPNPSLSGGITGGPAASVTQGGATGYATLDIMNPYIVVNYIIKY